VALQTARLVYQQLMKDATLMGVFRFWVPGTLWTGEIGMRGPSSGLVDGAAGKRLLAQRFSRNPDLCRVAKRDYILNEVNRIYLFEDPWFKATVATADPVAAQAFVTRYLGADGLESPYENPVANCHHAKWAVLHRGTSDTRPFMLHFVLSPEPAFHGGVPNVTTLSEAIRRGRRLDDDVFDSLMYNSLTLWVDDLAPHVARFISGSVPYTIRGWPSTGVGGVFVQIPGSESVLELRSDRGIDQETLAAHPWDACSRELAPSEFKRRERLGPSGLHDALYMWPLGR